jgi:O-antigen ligase
MPFRIVVVLIGAICGAITSAIFPFLGLLQLLFLVFGRPQDDRPNVAPLHIPLMIVSVILLGLIFRADTSLTRILYSLKRLWVFLVLYALMVLSAFNNWTVLSHGQLDDFSPLVVLCILTVAMITTEKRLRAYVLVLVASGTYVMSRAIRSGSHIHEEIGTEHFDRMAIAKGGTVFGNSNYLALFMVITIFLSISLMGFYRKFWQRIALLSVTGGCTYVFFRANSRGASLALGAGIIVMWVMNKRKLRTGLLVIALVGIGSLLAPDSYWERLKTISTYQNDPSATLRIELWDIALTLIPERPILGVGPNNFLYYAPNSPHDAYLQMAAEVGLPAALVYISWLIVGLYTSFRARRLSEDGGYLYALSQGVFCCVLTVVVQGFTTGLAHREVAYVFVTLAISIRGFVTTDLTRNLDAAATSDGELQALSDGAPMMIGERPM